jgi:hypothetical protein
MEEKEVVEVVGVIEKEGVLKSRRFISGMVAIVMLFVAPAFEQAFPGWTLNVDMISGFIITVALALIGGYTAQDVFAEIASALVDFLVSKQIITEE